MSEDWTVVGGGKKSSQQSSKSRSGEKRSNEKARPNEAKARGGEAKQVKPQSDAKQTKPRPNEAKPQRDAKQAKPQREAKQDKHRPGRATTADKPRSVPRILPLRGQPIPPPPPPRITFASIAKKAVVPKVEETKLLDTRLRLPPLHPYRWGSVTKCSVEDPSVETWKYHYEDKIRSVMKLLDNSDFDEVGEYLYNLAPDKKIDVWA